MPEYISRNIDKELIAWKFEYIDKEDNNAIRHVTILPLYALSQLRK